MNVRFDGKRALVTGGGRGIGRAIAERLLECGAHVVVIDKMVENLEKLKAELPDVETVPLDLSDWPVAEGVIRGLGHIDLLVNNAGVMLYGPVLESIGEVLDKTMDVNFKSYFNVCAVVAEGMIEAKSGGAMVNLASIAGHRAFKDMAAYCCSKAAVIQLTRCLALELGKHGIRVNCVSPGPIMTEMKKADLEDPQILAEIMKRTPIGRYGQPGDVANVVAFLLSDFSSFATGADYPVDGGHLARSF